MFFLPRLSFIPLAMTVPHPDLVAAATTTHSPLVDMVPKDPKKPAKKANG
jgi:hypothetical protein